MITGSDQFLGLGLLDLPLDRRFSQSARTRLQASDPAVDLIAGVAKQVGSQLNRRDGADL